MAVELPEYLPLEEAAHYYKINPKALVSLVGEGKVRAIKIGQVLAVAMADIQELQIPTPSEEMKGRAIRAKDAVAKYKIASHSTLSGWRKRGVVTVIKQEHRNVTYDEYSVAVAAQMYHSRQQKQGIRYKSNGH